MLLPDQSVDPTIMAEALKRLPFRQPPSKSGGNMRLEGLDHISQTVGRWIDGRGSHLSLVGAE
jgi:predicted glycosyltransferase